MFGLAKGQRRRETRSSLNFPFIQSNAQMSHCFENYVIATRRLIEKNVVVWRGAGGEEGRYNLSMPIMWGFRACLKCVPDCFNRHVGVCSSSQNPHTKRKKKDLWPKVFVLKERVNTNSAVVTSRTELSRLRIYLQKIRPVMRDPTGNE